MSLKGNRTLEILAKAERGGYGVLAHAVYDTQMAVGLVRAAERAQSPAILQFFPPPFMYGKASVPISVHLDHATDPEQVQFALDLAEKGIPLDSIMLDGSRAETDEENIALTKPYVELFHKCGVAVEVELGRVEGGEQGLRGVSNARPTDPKKVRAFLEGTGADIIAPSIGNLHGLYIKSPSFNQQILKDIHSEFNGRIPICLHGTGGIPEPLFRECIKNGVSKVNINVEGRTLYAKALGEGLLSKPFPEAVENATEVFTKECERFMTIFGSTEKAGSAKN
ncbi:hypothetical protein CVT25_009284 [Psilocybe cyanescens]|uniref:Fructose-bisphosphate aldolase n=1 Tax=Psilocybe cyanescens TaxID=93625 RepID=A0A409WW95_PSICY|nr:hypothetical protein CVT25_009284 [Psilocybe cyanescens]